jgi:hypothetical protein
MRLSLTTNTHVLGTLPIHTLMDKGPIPSLIWLCQVTVACPLRVFFTSSSCHFVLQPMVVEKFLVKQLLMVELIVH